MAESLTEPDVITQPFAQNGDKNTIPATNDPATGLASLAYGFPPITSVRLDNGGKAPRRADVNGAINLISQQNFFAQNGGTNTFRQAVSDAIGGYPLNARLTYTDPNGNSVVLRSNKANNSDNFVSDTSFIGNSWIPESPALSWNNVWSGNNTFNGSVSLNGTLSASQSVKQSIVGWGVPDCDSSVSITSPYTPTKDGIIIVQAISGYSNCNIIDNTTNIILARHGSADSSSSANNIWAVVSAGREYAINSSGGVQRLFIPFKGV